MIEFLKRAYEQVYDLPYYYLGIQGELACHLFSIFFILALFLSMLYLIKEMIGFRKRGKESKKLKRKMEKSLLGAMEEHNKNKKVKNT